ncbi:MAG: hypothetical protein K9W44_06585 [Candidatus Lokiarchaeota archaeon]|nr:hypothetical protein [Candidatus Harpocratesius repetitus]
MAEFTPEEMRSDQYYEKKLVKDLQPTDGLVQLTGYARNINANNDFYIDDTTGKIQTQNIPDDAPKITEGNLYRVFGKYEVDGTGTPVIAAQIIQDMQELDFNFYLKTMEKFKEIQ